MTARDVIAGVLVEHGINRRRAEWITDALIRAGVTMPEQVSPSAGPSLTSTNVCGASVVIAGVEYVCDRERGHTEPVHECTDDVGVMQWRDSDSDEGPVVVRAWTHDGSDGWPVRPARAWRKRCEGDADDERRCCLTEGHDGECR